MTSSVRTLQGQVYWQGELNFCAAMLEPDDLACKPDVLDPQHTHAISRRKSFDYRVSFLFHIPSHSKARGRVAT